jgi:hypothetical protein
MRLIRRNGPMEEIEVRVRGQIGKNWSDWLGGLTVAHTENGETILTGSVRDQSALLGLVTRLAGLGLRILSVASRQTSPQDVQGGASDVDANG